RYGDAVLDRGAAELFAPDDRLEDLALVQIVAGRGQQLTEDVQRVLLAAGLDIGEDATGLEQSSETHCAINLGRDCTRRTSGQALPTGVAGVLIGELVLVPANLAVQPIGKTVDGRVHILFDTFRMQCSPGDAQCRFSFV